MISQEAITYATTLLASGQTQAQISETLIAAGWQPAQIEELFKLIPAPTPTPRKKPYFLLLLFGIVLIILLVTAAFFGRSYLNKKTPTTEINPITLPTPAVTSISERATLTVSPVQPTYQAGQTITLTISPLENAPIKSVLFVAGDVDAVSKQIEVAPFTTTITIPTDTVGNYLISATVRHTDTVVKAEDISTLETSLTIQ